MRTETIQAGRASGEAGAAHDKSKGCEAGEKPPCDTRELFRRFSHATATGVGSPWSFLAALLIIITWGVTGPLFHFSDTWQLVINTATTIVTFLMVFLIQNTQNRDARAIHLKLDELIHAAKGARNNLINLENLSEEEIVRFEKQFALLREREKRKSQKPAPPA